MIKNVFPINHNIIVFYFYCRKKILLATSSVCIIFQIINHKSFPKYFLNILMVLLFEYLLFHHFLFNVFFFCLDVSEALSVSLGKSITSLLLFIAGSSLQYCYKGPVFSNNCHNILLNYKFALLHQWL